MEPFSYLYLLTVEHYWELSWLGLVRAQLLLTKSHWNPIMTPLTILHHEGAGCWAPWTWASRRSPTPWHWYSWSDRTVWSLTYRTASSLSNCSYGTWCALTYRTAGSCSLRWVSLRWGLAYKVHEGVQSLQIYLSIYLSVCLSIYQCTSTLYKPSPNP